MPGRTPVEAFGAFIQPIEKALACLGPAKITPSPKHLIPDRDNAWTINGTSGLVLTGGFHFQAVMGYRIIAHEDGYRVTTLRYMYRIAEAGKEIALIHWHPDGNSDYLLPHIHLPEMENGREHLPTGRMTFEDAVEWMIKLSGQSTRSDWLDVLDESREKHRAYRSWSDRPPAGALD